MRSLTVFLLANYFRFKYYILLNPIRLLFIFRTTNVEQQLFTAGKVSVCNEGGEQIVTSAWSGHTFVIDTQSNIVCFEVGQAIQSFISGVYANNKSTSFIYVTYSNKVYAICFKFSLYICFYQSY